MLGNNTISNTDVYRQFLVSVINNQIPDIVKFNFFFWTEICLSTSAFTFDSITKILKTEFYLFCTQTYRNLKSVKFSNSLHVLYALENLIA